MKRILVIRGGAIGDFILTLPAIKLLRDHFPDAHIEILGCKHIIALAEKRFYADAIRSIDDRALAGFFTKTNQLPIELIRYFAGFDLILSYLFDSEAIFRTNLHFCGIKTLLTGPAKLSRDEHAAYQLARPLKEIGLSLHSPAARIYPTERDREFARDFLTGLGTPVLAFHPGSGSEAKNWPLENWMRLGEHFLASGWALLIAGGEADEKRVRCLEIGWQQRPVRFARNLSLPHLAGLLENGVFVGHDSGISHIAAAVGARSLLLFGSTDPAVWAPANANATVLRASEGDLCSLDVGTVIEKVTESSHELMR